MDPASNARTVIDALGPDHPWNLTWVSETGSTNADLMAAADRGDPAGEVLVADHQSAGRGRRERTWTAPPGATLLVSVLLRPDCPPADAHLAAGAVALAAGDACHVVAGVRPGLKWPNDLVVETGEGTRKLAGVLTESVSIGGRLEAVVVGIGINVNWPGELPEELTSTATALSHLTGAEVDRPAVLAAMLEALTGRAEMLSAAEGRARLAVEMSRECVTIGRQVRVELVDGEVTGLAVALSPAGHLLIDTNGKLEAVAVGDVVHLR